jgi:hypothetical protein
LDVANKYGKEMHLSFQHFNNWIYTKMVSFVVVNENTADSTNDVILLQVIVVKFSLEMP